MADAWIFFIYPRLLGDSKVSVLGAGKPKRQAIINRPARVGESFTNSRPHRLREALLAKDCWMTVDDR